MYYEVKTTRTYGRASGSLYTHTQAQEPKWGLHNSVIDYTQNQTSPLPNILNTEYTQNAVWDPNGNILIYEADGIVYNKMGGVILDMTIAASAPSFYDANFGILKGFTEFIFVPVPKSCNEYYGITTYSNGVVYNNYISDVVWCKINVSSGTAITLPQTGLKLAKESISCTTRGVEANNLLDYQMHIEISQDQGGFRYLFASNSSCVSVLNVDADKISFIDGYQTGGSFIPNFRSEMEVYQDGDIFEVAMHSFKNSGQNPTNSLSIFTFNMGGSTPVISHYKVAISGESNQKRFIKGLEFSKDGLTLYATITTVNSTPSIIAGKSIVYFSRTTLGNPFTYGSHITSGTSTMDFGLGMLEKGKDGKLWIVGDNRLATLADFDNPLSAFIPNAMPFSNTLTLAHLYNHRGPNSTIPPTTTDIINRKIYLMIDQVDGEDYSQWIFGNNLYPSVVSSCTFPFNFSIPLNTGVNFYPPPAGMYGGGTVSIPHPGSLELIYNQGTACESVEIVKFIETEERYCPADFTYSFTVAKTTSNAVNVTSICEEDQSNVLHSFYLYEMDGQGNWVYIDNCGSPSCVLSPINLGNQYKIVHIVQNLNSICHAVETDTQYFNY
tara:strand:- start:1072 stop:2901 length:1830 start_codon:yes stop_codon:yes gene_type:complete